MVDSLDMFGILWGSTKRICIGFIRYYWAWSMHLCLPHSRADLRGVRGFGVHQATGSRRPVDAYGCWVLLFCWWSCIIGATEPLLKYMNNYISSSKGLDHDELYGNQIKYIEAFRMIRMCKRTFKKGPFSAIPFLEICLLLRISKGFQDLNRSQIMPGT